jgi:putative transposase
VESDGRKHPTHATIRDRFNTATIIFLTVCTKNRRSILANEAAHFALKSAWQIQPTWSVGRYVVMPDHIHLFCSPRTLPAEPLSPWVKFWKSKACQLWPFAKGGGIWQRDFWDTQLRRGENYDQKWHYVLQNPVRAGLIKDVENWPYQGEIERLEW